MKDRGGLGDFAMGERSFLLAMLSARNGALRRARGFSARPVPQGRGDVTGSIIGTGVPFLRINHFRCCGKRFPFGKGAISLQ